MRRLLAVLALAATLPVVPPTAAAPRPATVRHVAGRVTLDAVPPAERLHRAYEAAARSKESRAILRLIEPALSGAAADTELRLATAVPVPDFDLDGVGDVLLYDATVRMEEYHAEGETTLEVVSGRTGRRVWRRTWEDLPAPLPYVAKVGDRKNGLVLVDPFSTPDEWGWRFVGIEGRGRIAYDRTIRENDERGGDVIFGGLFDALTGGGTDILIARVERPVEITTSIGGLTPPLVDFSQAYVIDGRDGALSAVSEREAGIGHYPAFVTVGDIDGDNRDDYAMFRRGLHEWSGTVAVRSVVENKKIWTNDAVPLGRSVYVSSPGNYVADKRGDLMYLTWMSGEPLLEVPPVTDEMPLFHGGLAGTHAVFLDGRDGSLDRRLGDGSYTSYMPFADVDRDGLVDLVTLAWTANSREGGIEMSLLTKAGESVRWRRSIMVPADVPGAASGGAWVENAGDVDGDRLADFHYEIYFGSTALTRRRASGFVFLRTGATIATRDLPLYGTLDGRGTDRWGWTESKDTLTVSLREGRTGATWWRVAATSRDLAFGVSGLTAQRGRCDGVLLVGVARTKADAGKVWAAVLDGGTGRVRWSRALSESPARPAIRPLGGPVARCR